MYNIASYAPIATKKDLYDAVELALERDPNLGVVFTEASDTASDIATVTSIDFNGTVVPVTALPSAYVYTLATDGSLADVKLGNALVQTKGIGDSAVTFYEVVGGGSFSKVAVDNYSIGYGSDSNVEITVDSGYAVTNGDPFNEVWVFAVKGNGFGEAATAAYPELLQDSMLAYYNAYQSDAISGTTIKDYSGKGKDAVMAQGTTTTIVDNAFVFDGSNYFSLTDFTSNVGKWSHSVSIWVNMDKYPYIEAQGNPWGVCPWFIGTTIVPAASTNRSMSCFWFSQNSWYFSFYADALLGGDYLTFTTNTWYHMCFVYDSTVGTYGTQYVYVDGVELASRSLTGDPVIPANPTLEIGGRGIWGQTTGTVVTSRGTQGFEGKIRTIAVYDKVLTASEVSTLYDYEIAAPGVIYPQGTPAWTSSQLQTMATLFTQVATEGEAYHKISTTSTTSTISATSFEGKTFTHAFSSIDGAGTELLTADGEYTVVAVGEQGTGTDVEYVAGYASLTEGSGPVSTLSSPSVPNGVTSYTAGANEPVVD